MRSPNGAAASVILVTYFMDAPKCDAAVRERLFSRESARDGKLWQLCFKSVYICRAKLSALIRAHRLIIVSHRVCVFKEERGEAQRLNATFFQM